MRNLLITLLLCGIAQFASAAASAECAAPTVAQPEQRGAQLISAAAAQPPIATAAAQPATMMVPASVRANGTQVMGGPPGQSIAEAAPESPRRGSRLVMMLAAVGVMLVIVLRRVGAWT